MITALDVTSFPLTWHHQPKSPQIPLATIPPTALLFNKHVDYMDGPLLFFETMTFAMTMSNKFTIFPDKPRIPVQP